MHALSFFIDIAIIFTKTQYLQDLHALSLLNIQINLTISLNYNRLIALKKLQYCIPLSSITETIYF